MGKIEPGTIAHIKITDEPVFVLSVRPIEGFHAMANVLSGVIAKVRRPNVDEHGRIVHNIEDFLIDELETEDDAAIRKVHKMEELKAQFEAERSAKTPSKLAISN